MSRTSKFMSMVLRHSPESAGLTLDAGGWIALDDLLLGLKKAGHPTDRATLIKIVADDDKQRFTISQDGNRIRAAQGHSISVDLGLAEMTPPAELYHGTASATLDNIFAEGLKPRRRQHVHLSKDIETAASVGRRHGKPVVLKVDTMAMHAAGHKFWRADNGVWLTDAVPPNHLSFA